MLAKILGVGGVLALVIIGGVLVFKNNVADPAASVAAVAKAVNKRSPTPVPASCVECLTERAKVEAAQAELIAATKKFDDQLAKYNTNIVTYDSNVMKRLMADIEKAVDKYKPAKEAYIKCLEQSTNPTCKELAEKYRAADKKPAAPAKPKVPAKNTR